MLCPQWPTPLTWSHLSVWELKDILDLNLKSQEQVDLSDQLYIIQSNWTTTKYWKAGISSKNTLRCQIYMCTKRRSECYE